MKTWCLVLVLAGLAGCASLSEEQCRQAGATSWEGVGLADGQDGREADQRLEMHRDACGKIGIAPDRAAYMKGWSRGVLDYCTPDRAYSIGLSGFNGNDRLCPGNTGHLFRANIQLGQRVHHLKREIERTQDEIRDFEKKLSDKNLDRDTKLDLQSRIRQRDRELSHLRQLLIEAQSIPLIRQ